MIAVGLTLQPELAFLELLGDVLRDEPDYFQVAPETTWRERADGALVENGYARVFRALGDETGLPFVAHGVGLSVGSASPGDAPRQQRWLERLRLDQQRFNFCWYTDHLGATAMAGAAIVLPVATPMTMQAALGVRRALAQLQRVCPDVGVENSVPYFFVGDARDEPAFLQAALDAPGMHLLLDLHNVFTVAENAGFSPDEYLDRIDLTRVIEIHVSGGSYSAPGWLPDGRVLRLDGHDGAVPDEVFRLLERVAPRCPNLRGVTLERMEGTVSQGDVAPLREELRAVRRIVQSRRDPAPLARGPRTPPARPALPAASEAAHLGYEAAMVRILHATDPGDALTAERDREGQDPAVRGWLHSVDEDGLRMAALLVARLRFERLTRGSDEVDAWFERDPAGFTEVFRGYHASTTAEFFPAAEARNFARWMAR